MNVYLRLMRFDKPAGIVLLWAPTVWALWLANHGRPSYLLLLYFFCGTVLMRAAGCIVNDIADRSIDTQVKRTRRRPLAAGEVSIKHAVGLLLVLLLLAGIIALQLPPLCWLLAVLALIVTLIYPFGKRFFQAPQLILGVAFSMGIPMAYVASGVAPDRVMALLMLLNFLWIVAYDTIYALADKEDDLRIGVKSTAIFFGAKVAVAVMLLQVSFHGLWLVLGMVVPLSAWFDLCWLLGLGLLIYQNILLKTQVEQDYMRAFLLNALYGLVMWVALV